MKEKKLLESILEKKELDDKLNAELEKITKKFVEDFKRTLPKEK